MLNKVMLIGNLGADPDVLATTKGVPVATMRIATTEFWKDQAGEKKEYTEWHRVVAFNRQAEIAGELLRKGLKVYVEGRNQTRKYQDSDGEDRWITEVVAHRINILSPKSGSVPPNMDDAPPPPEPPGGEPPGDDDEASE